MSVGRSKEVQRLVGMEKITFVEISNAEIRPKNNAMLYCMLVHVLENETTFRKSS